MEPGTSLSRKPNGHDQIAFNADPIAEISPRSQGIRMRVLLILAVSGIIIGTTFVSLLAIRRPLRNLIVQNLSSDLLHSLATFESMQSQQIAALDRENALLADLPSLKALMTTSDERTIVDGGVEFWKTGGNDLFALADRDGAVKAAYLTGASADSEFRENLSRFITKGTSKYFVSANGLYGCSVKPLYFGSPSEGTLLGYVISGFAINHKAVENLSSATNVQAMFRSGSRTLASSFPSADQSPLELPDAAKQSGTFRIIIGGEQFLAVAHDLSSTSTAPLALIEFKSLDQEEMAIRKIDRLVLLAGLLALALGAACMLALSRFVTRTLEQLATGVRAFASGDTAHILPYRGTREVRELSAAFARMRREIVQANQALLESERLATIGRMASSVSHDLRHYLSAIYANSEFLASDKLPPADRSEVLAEIRTAVDGTTEMLESLLMFSRTGTALKRTEQSVTAIAERALHLVRAHPDAAGVALTLRVPESTLAEAFVEAKQIERAVYNLLLNACQATRAPGVPPTVAIPITVKDNYVVIEVIDNGAGVPPNIMGTLFEPFVSQGKHKGSGLGLTLTQSIAVEHGGDVALVSSRNGETVFRMTIARTIRNSRSQVINRAQVGSR
jgi:signal transduction histidine kinase